MPQFPWQKSFIVDSKEEQEKKEEKEKPQDQPDTVVRYLPWLFADNDSKENS